MEKAVAALPAIDFEGKLVTPKRGVYSCPYRCHSGSYAPPKWKTEKGFRKHMGECRCSPSAWQRQQAEQEALAAERAAKIEEALATTGLRIGDKVFVSSYTVTKPTHAQKFGRMVRVRYEEGRHYYGAAITIESFGFHGGLTINSRGIPLSALKPTLAEAIQHAAEAQKRYDDDCAFAAACR